MQNSLYQQAITEVYISLELLIECNLFGTIPVLWRSKLEIINWRRAKTDMDGGENICCILHLQSPGLAWQCVDLGPAHSRYTDVSIGNTPVTKI